jgi:transposase-like protein
MTPILIKYKYQDLLSLAAMQGKDIYENELNKLSNLKVYNQDKPSIQVIFATYWDTFKLHFSHLLRPAIIENVEKMIKCRNLRYGYLFFECPSCDNYHLQGLSCHSRFCPSCNQTYRLQRTLAIQSKLMDCPHRHFVFSIAKEMRKYFWMYRGLFDILFQTVNEALHLSIRKTKDDIKLDRRLGIISFLHSYGRDMKTNPHIHALVAERLIDKDQNISVMSFFPFERLRKCWQYLLLKNVSDYLKDHASKADYHRFNRLRTFLIKKYTHGFYTYGPQVDKQPSIKKTKQIADYIARYASHPAIAESRIDNFDPVSHTVTWHFDPHEDDHISNENLKLGRQTITEHVYKFMIKLIKHIPDKGFHLIRYYGFYANRTTKKPPSIKKLISASYVLHLKRQINWVYLLKSTYKYNPIRCHCGSLMILNLDASFLPNSTKEGFISDA